MIWFVALGGAVGSVVRFVLGSLVQERAGTFPLGTLVVNVTGSLLLGALMEYALSTPAISRDMRALLTTGFCGGYTTFSTFSYETVRLAQEGDYRRAGLYVVLSVLGSLAAAFAGFALAREVLVWRRGL
jgi:fluoride exporter